MPYPWKLKAEYDGSEYSLDHLVDLKKTFKSIDETQTFKTTFKFHYHCFTDHTNALGEYRKPFNDDAFVDDGDRVFCPNRWWLSLKLPLIVDGLSEKRLLAVGGAQWQLNWSMPNIDSPYAVFFKVTPGDEKAGIIVHVMSAYLKKNAHKKGNESGFLRLLSLASRGEIPGK